MPRTKLSKQQLDYKEGLAHFKAWLKMNKEFEDRGLHGTDYYVRIVEELEAKVKQLEAKLKRKAKK
jgi:hypothetical protein